jgi:hypothetical protein
MSNASRYLQRIAFIILCIHGSVSAKAQQNWFLFIQSESNQPFYVRIGETIYSSSHVGHLVINGLRDSTYRLAIGFPQSQYREHQFSLPLKKKDYGFELKKSDARSWILYDWQAQETIKSPRTDSLLYGERKKDDGFATLMAAVVNDSAVLYASVVKAEPMRKTEKDIQTDSAIVAKTNVETKPIAKTIDSAAKDTTAIVQEKKMVDTAKTEPVVVKTTPPKIDSSVTDSVTTTATAKDTIALVNKEPVKEDKTPPVSKLYEQGGKEEKKLVFLDNSIGIKKDTITVIIPLEKDSAKVEEKSVAKTETKDSEKSKPDSAEKKTVAVSPAQTLMDSVAAIKKPDTVVSARAEMKRIDSTIFAEKEPGPEKPLGLIMMNSDCSKYATDNDVDKLRIKMMKEKDAGNRVFIAHKVFKEMCFSTRNIKALSELFPSDELRFRFYETAWPFVSDTTQFKSLEETLTDQFFITRFRTLLRRQ